MLVMTLTPCFPRAAQLETSFTNKETPGRDFSGDDRSANDSSSPEIVCSNLREGFGNRIVYIVLIYFECKTSQPLKLIFKYNLHCRVFY